MPCKRIDLSSRIASKSRVCLFSLTAGCIVFTIALLLQWLVYDDWMHWGGPLRIVGSTLAGVLTFVLSWHWQSVRRKQTIEMLRRFETIAWMNDRIRNALQAIQCVDYAANSCATDSVRNAVAVIDSVLREVLSEAHPVLRTRRLEEGETAPSHPESRPSSRFKSDFRSGIQTSEYVANDSS
jgi:Flp pilus assembly protein TadB